MDGVRYTLRMRNLDLSQLSAISPRRVLTHELSTSTVYDLYQTTCRRMDDLPQHYMQPISELLLIFHDERVNQTIPRTSTSKGSQGCTAGEQRLEIWNPTI